MAGDCADDYYALLGNPAYSSRSASPLRRLVRAAATGCRASTTPL